jgi:UDP-N-acetylmuramoylalanine--D-glutamate ligase
MSKRIVILGSGESGAGAAVLAKVKGFDVFVSDAGKIREDYKQLLDKYEIKWEEGSHTEALILNADEIIKSPGIPEKAAMVKAARAKGIHIISEIEFAGRYNTAKTICITGSNGKTTTTSLIYHMIQKAGLNVGLAGNIGQSFALQVATKSFDYYVIELSSFQLDGMYDFRCDIAILCNITPDHLDRYEYKMQNYVDSKFRITQNMGPEQCFIYCADDPVTIEELSKRSFTTKLLGFTLKEEKISGAYIKNNTTMMLEFDDLDFSMPLGQLSLKGKHNTYNSMAAAIAGNVLNIKKDHIRESLSDFQGVEHRLEPVSRVHGIEFINDSKATNVNSTWYALESMTTPVIWIAGGTDKGNDYSELYDLVRQKVKALVCMGKDNSKLHKAFDNMIPIIVDTESMEEAIKSAYFLAKDGDTVLLSPACASFDLFANYEDRGRQFKQCVRNL